MKLNEVPSRDAMTLNLKNWSSLTELRKFLKSKGYKKLGGGAYAEAWANKQAQRVVKISTKEDKCWMRYIEWLKMQPASPHLPKVHSFRTYKTGRGTFFVSILETLEETDKFIDELFKSTAVNPTLPRLALVMWIMDISWEQSIRYRVQFVRKENVEKYLNQQPKYKKLNPVERAEELTKSGYRTKLALLGKKAERELGKDGCQPDLHGGNVMYRPSDKTLVITDPIARSWSTL